MRGKVRFSFGEGRGKMKIYEYKNILGFLF
jgi:hypothetical protein